MRVTTLLLLAGLASPAFAADEAPATPSAPDAAMSLSEYQAAFRQRLMAADSDRDGKLSESELAAARGAMGGPREGTERRIRPRRDPSRMFKMLDTNGDGFLDASELDAMSARRFASMDANGDGKVTAEEREAGRGQWRDRMGSGSSDQSGGWDRGRGMSGGMGTGDDQPDGSEQPDD